MDIYDCKTKQLEGFCLGDTDARNITLEITLNASLTLVFIFS